MFIIIYSRHVITRRSYYITCIFHPRKHTSSPLLRKKIFGPGRGGDWGDCWGRKVDVQLEIRVPFEFIIKGDGNEQVLHLYGYISKVNIIFRWPVVTRDIYKITHLYATPIHWWKYIRNCQYYMFILIWSWKMKYKCNLSVPSHTAHQSLHNQISTLTFW